MDKIKCHCSNSGQNVCTKHKLFLCEKHSIEHNKCGIQNLINYQKKIITLKESTLSAIQNFKKEKTQILFKLKRENEAQSRGLLEKSNLISQLIEKMIDLNKIKKRTYFENSLDFPYEKLIAQVENGNNSLFLLENILQGKEIKDLNSDLIKKNNDIKEVMKDDLMTKSILKVLEEQITTYKNTCEFLLGSNLSCPVDFLEASKKIIEINQITNIKSQVSKSKTSKIKFEIYNMKIGILNKKKKREDIHESLLHSEEAYLNSNYEQEMDIRFRQNSQKGFRNRGVTRKGRETDLIVDNMFLSKLNPKNNNNLNEEEDEIAKINEEDEEDSLIDFDDEDFNLEDEESDGHEVENEDYFDNFNKIKSKLSVMLDQVLYDMNCVNFFDKNQRNKINEYFDSFVKFLTILVSDLKTNFSKM